MRRAHYDRDSADRLREALARIVPVFERFRAGFHGKASPVHFFWGSFDLAVTRFSGRQAPPHPGGVPGLPDRITREAYSHEVSSAGFWPGGVDRGRADLLQLRLSRAGRVSRARQCRPTRRGSTRRSANSSCPMTRCARRPIPEARC